MRVYILTDWTRSMVLTWGIWMMSLGIPVSCLYNWTWNKATFLPIPFERVRVRLPPAAYGMYVCHRASIEQKWKLAINQEKINKLRGLTLPCATLSISSIRGGTVAVPKFSEAYRHFKMCPSRSLSPHILLVPYDAYNRSLNCFSFLSNLFRCVFRLFAYWFYFFLSLYTFVFVYFFLSVFHLSFFVFFFLFIHSFLSFSTSSFLRFYLLSLCFLR